VVRIKKDKNSRGRERRGNRGRIKRGIWNEEGRETFRNKMKEIELAVRGARIEGEKWKGD